MKPLDENTVLPLRLKAIGWIIATTAGAVMWATYMTWEISSLKEDVAAIMDHFSIKKTPGLPPVETEGKAYAADPGNR